MLLKVFSVFDSKLQIFNTPFFRALRLTRPGLFPIWSVIRALRSDSILTTFSFMKSASTLTKLVSS